jgi:hypothetical protein
MYTVVKVAFTIMGGILILWGIVVMIGNFLNSLLFYAVGVILLYLSRLIHAPQIVEAPPPEFDYTTDFRKETIMAKKMRANFNQEGESKPAEAEEAEVEQAQ